MTAIQCVAVDVPDQAAARAHEVVMPGMLASYLVGPAVALTRFTSPSSTSAPTVRYTVSSEIVGTRSRTP